MTQENKEHEKKNLIILVKLSARILKTGYHVLSIKQPIKHNPGQANAILNTNYLTPSHVIMAFFKTI